MGHTERLRAMAREMLDEMCSAVLDIPEDELCREIRGRAHQMNPTLSPKDIETVLEMVLEGIER